MSLPLTIEALDAPALCTCGQTATCILHYKFQNQDTRHSVCDRCGMAFIEVLQTYPTEAPVQQEAQGVTPLLAWTKLSSEHVCAGLCGRPAFNLISVLTTKHSYVYCGPCMVGFFLEFAKAEGIDVDTICLGFPEQSQRLEKPLGSILLQ